MSENDMEINQNMDLIRKMASVKHKDILRESIAEYQRKGNFVRIFPA